MNAILLTETIDVKLPDKSIRLNSVNRDELFEKIKVMFPAGTTVSRYFSDRNTSNKWFHGGNYSITNIDESSTKLARPYDDLKILTLSGEELLETIQADGHGILSHKVAVYTKNSSDWLYLRTDFYSEKSKTPSYTGTDKHPSSVVLKKLS